MWCRLIDALSFIDVHNGFFIAFFTFVIAIFTINLWRGAEKSSKRELRAYVHIEPIQPVDVIWPSTLSGIDYGIRMINFGKTPARDVILSIGIWPEKYPVDLKMLPPPMEHNIDSIGPGQSIGWSINSVSQIGESEREAVHAKWDAAIQPFSFAGNLEHKKDFAVFVYGKCVYRDIFGLKCETGFRFRHRYDGNSVGMMMRYIETDFTNPGNYAT